MIYLSGCHAGSVGIEDDGLIKAIVWEVEAVRREIGVDTLSDNSNLVSKYYEDLLDEWARVNILSRDANILNDEYDSKETYMLKEIPDYLDRFNSYTLDEIHEIQVLDLRAFNIVNLEEIRVLKNLVSLTLTYENDLDTTVLGKLSNIESIIIEGSRMKNVNGLERLSNLRSLALWNVQLETSSFKFSGLENFVLSGAELLNNEIELKMTSLYRFTIYDCYSTEGISVIADVPEAKEVEIIDSNVRKVKFGEVGNLLDLNISGCEIEELSFLEKVSALEKLNLSNNLITAVDGIENVEQLETLYLFGNQIIDITPLSRLSKLKTLHLESNQIESIDALKDLKKLRTLDIRDNNIKDFSSLKNFSYIRYLQYDE